MNKLFFPLLLPFYIFAADIIVVTATIGEEYKKITYPGLVSKLNYCKKNGYDFYVLDKNLDITRPLPWSKIVIIKKLLAEYKYVFWSDADSLIMNHEIRIENLIDDIDDHDLHICLDNVSNVINSGQFLLKKSKKSFDFLDDVYNCEYAIHHHWWENKAIIDLLGTENYSKFAKIYDQRRFNSFGNIELQNNPSIFYQKGDFIIHFPSVKGLELQKLMYQYGKNVAHPVFIPMNTIINN